MELQFSMSRIRLLLAMLSFYSGMILTVGSATFFGVGTAGVIFQALPAKDWAGELNALILQRLTIVQFFGEGLILLGILIFAGSTGKFLRRIPVWIALLMILLTIGYGVILWGFMNELRIAITSFDHPTAQDQQLIQQFQHYHSLYTTLAGINWALGVLLFLWQTIQFAMKPVARSTSTPAEPLITVESSAMESDSSETQTTQGQQTDGGQETNSA